MKLSAIPNALSIFRMLLVVPAVVFLWEGRHLDALLVIALAVFTDGLDGFLAKRFGWRTRIGGILDPLADKLLFVCVFVVLGLKGLIPFWLMALVLLRDLVIVSGGLAYHLLHGPFEMSPTLLGKINTLVQFVFTLAVLVAAATGLPPRAVVEMLGFALVVTTLVSGLHYFWLWGRRAMNASSGTTS